MAEPILGLSIGEKPITNIIEAKEEVKIFPLKWSLTIDIPIIVPEEIPNP